MSEPFAHTILGVLATGPLRAHVQLNQTTVFELSVTTQITGVTLPTTDFQIDLEDAPCETYVAVLCEQPSQRTTDTTNRTTERAKQLGAKTHARHRAASFMLGLRNDLERVAKSGS